MRVQAENLLMVHPEKRSVQDSVAQFLQPPCHWSGYEINQKQEALVLNLILPDLEWLWLGMRFNSVRIMSSSARGVVTRSSSNSLSFSRSSSDTEVKVDSEPSTEISSTDLPNKREMMIWCHPGTEIPVNHSFGHHRWSILGIRELDCGGIQREAFVRA